MKNIGKPCAGEPHARFDEGGQVAEPALYSTLNSRVAKTYLHPDSSIFLIVGNESAFEKPLSDLGKMNKIELPK